MNTSKKKLSATLAIIVIAIVALSVFLAILNINSISSSQISVQDKAILAIKEIVGLDLTNYKVNISSHVNTNPLYNYNGSKVEDVICNLQSNQSNLYVTLTFVNSTLFDLNLSPYNCSLLSAYYSKQLPSDPLNATKVLLNRLQDYCTNSVYIKPMLDSLNSPIDLNSFNITMGNTKRQAVVQTQFIQVSRTFNYTSVSTSVSFMYTFGDVLDSPKSISFSFRDGVFEGFSNGWQLYEIGSEM